MTDKDLHDRDDRRPEDPDHAGKVIPMPKRDKGADKKLRDAHDQIVTDPPDGDDIAYNHSVLCQIGLPYRKVSDARYWERRQGAAHLLIQGGIMRDRATGHIVELGLPYGEKPRVIMMYLNTMAVRTQAPEIDIGKSMTDFARILELDRNGASLRKFRKQLFRLVKANITIGFDAGHKATDLRFDIASRIDLWLDTDDRQRIMWPETVTLGDQYFKSLVDEKHSVPLDFRAIRFLAGSSLALDVYMWLAQRLHRIRPGKPQHITWRALHQQFGPEYDRLRAFRAKFTFMLERVMHVYPDAKIDVDAATGLMLHNSKPPVRKPVLVVPKKDIIEPDPTF